MYVDDVITFSKNETDHVQHSSTILKCLCDAEMRVSQEKSKLIKKSIEFVGFVVTKNGAKTDP